MEETIPPGAAADYDRHREELLKWRRRRLASGRGRLRIAFWLVATTTLMCGGAAVMLAVAVLTLFRARRFYAEVIAKWLARAILWSAGVRIVVHQEHPFGEQQTIYVSNHTSTLDMFVLLALGLPNARYFMGGFLRKIIPLGIVTHVIGTFHTPFQSQPKKRVRCFQNAERVLRRTGESVYLSPEGRRITDGTIGHFNKGAFHLATNLQVPLLPLYIDVPPQINPGMSYCRMVPGTVDVYVLPAISKEGWKLEELIENKESVRDVFVRFQDELRNGERPTGGPQELAQPKLSPPRTGG
ncbi:MAG: 1-acyl-sn-glycerol-3-phosphate acyltransferase [Planctomycetes bacterium]|nr:1-acyl-sn-glycerol-3-phosphate acyltransferase [Planctomycetota bacterium]